MARLENSQKWLEGSTTDLIDLSLWNEAKELNERLRLIGGVKESVKETYDLMVTARINALKADAVAGE